jgi:iron(III) transport system substrate-binding protein
MDATGRPGEYPRRRFQRLATGAAIALIAAACTSAGATPSPTSSPATSPSAAASPTAASPSVEAFDLEALVAAAKKDGSLVALNSSGIVEDEGAAFEKKYGIKVEGIKMDEAEQAERITRETDAANVTVSVMAMSDGGILAGKLRPDGYVENWVPPDLASTIPDEWEDPLTQLWKAQLFFYNTEATASCPIKNIWQLTEPDWRGKVAMQDPLGKPKLIDWFSYLVGDQVDELDAAFQAQYGKALQTTEQNAGYEFIKRLAANSPILQKGDEEASEAVGAPGQSSPPVGFFASTKLRNNEDKGYKLGVCGDLQPWAGFAYPKYIQIVSKGPAPNAARLFAHFLLTDEGGGIALAEGGSSGNEAVTIHENLPGLADWNKQLMFMSASNNEAAWSLRQPLQDFWRLNHQ